MLTSAPFELRGRRTLLLAGDAFSTTEAKTAACYLMYRTRDVVCVLDAKHANQTCDKVVGYGGRVPVVGTIDDALRLHPQQAIVGTAPMGGALEEGLRGQIAACLVAGVDVVSGLHTFVADDGELTAMAEKSGAQIWDVRRVSQNAHVSTGVGCTTGAKTVAVVGTDCNVGKMTVAVELAGAFSARGVRAVWAATGQTGIMLRGRGVCVDRVISDFIGGATEELVNVEGAGSDIVFVEGQGSITHPGYAGVTLGILYGAMPDCMVLAHVAGRAHYKRLDLVIPPVTDIVRLHEQLMAPHKPSRVVALAVNTSALADAPARREVDRLQEQTGLPTTDVIRFGCAAIYDAIAAATIGNR